MFQKRFQPQKEANEELRGSPGQELPGSPKKTCTSGGFFRSRRAFRAPTQLMKRFSPQNGRLGANFEKLSKGLRRKTRAPSQFFAFRRKKHIFPNFGKIASVPQKESISKVCKKFDKTHSSHSAETTVFTI